MWACLAPHDATEQAKVWKCPKKKERKKKKSCRIRLRTFLSPKRGHMAKFGVANILIVFTSLNSAFWERCAEQLPFFFPVLCSVTVMVRSSFCFGTIYPSPVRDVDHLQSKRRLPRFKRPRPHWKPGSALVWSNNLLACANGMG